MTRQTRTRIDQNRGRPIDARTFEQSSDPLKFAIRHRNISSASGVLTLDLAQANSFTCTLTENITSIDVNGPMRTDQFWFFYLELIQEATARTVTWPAAFLFPGGTDHVMSTGNADIDSIFGYSLDGGSNWRCRFETNYA